MVQVEVAKRRGEFALDARFSAPIPGVTALFGRSGCGKSTLIALLAGLLTPDRGRITFGDDVLVDVVHGVNVDARHRRMGVVFQDARLLPHLSVLGNLRYGAKRIPRGTEARIRLDDVVSLLGIAPLLDRRPRDLSGGERQRVALGRALLVQPRMLLLDEPLAALDRPRREEVLPYLEKLRDAFSIPILYVSHQFEEVSRLAARVVLLDAGRVVLEGDIESVSRDARLRDIVGAEAVGAVVTGRIERVDGSGLACLRVGDAELLLELDAPSVGRRMRIQVLARDVIIATAPPVGLSVRNVLPARIERLADDAGRAVLVELDLGQGAKLLARITTRACAELALVPGRGVWALVKAVSLRGHAFSAPAA